MHSRLPGARKPAVDERSAVPEEAQAVLRREARSRAVSSKLTGPFAKGLDRVRAARRWYQERSWLPGRVFAAATQAPALLAVAWLLPGFAMLLSGRLLPAPMLIIFLPLAVALCYFAMRQLPASWPKFGPGVAAPDAGARPADGEPRRLLTASPQPAAAGLRCPRGQCS